MSKALQPQCAHFGGKISDSQKLCDICWFIIPILCRTLRSRLIFYAQCMKSNSPYVTNYSCTQNQTQSTQHSLMMAPRECQNMQEGN